jgi:outer membrane receptor for ferrienterochelin and colicin
MNLGSNSIRFLMAAFFCLTLSIGFAFAQAGTGGITGVVSDANGAVVPNATVKALSTETGAQQTTTASSEGVFTFTLLRPGKYTVTANAANFSEQKLEVEVQVGRITDANFALGAGNVSAEVTITAEGVQTTVSNSDAVLNETAITNLPSNGRRFQDLATLTPGAQVDTERNQISLSGQRGINANINVDGVDYNQPFFGGIRGGERSNFAPTIPQESIKEFQVVAAGYNAEFGRSSGGIVNVVTKGGTNRLRGSAFYLLRPERLSINHEFVKRVETERNLDISGAPTQQQAGGSIGGPIAQDKLFYFGSFELQKFRSDRLVDFGLGAITTSTANQEAINFFRNQQTNYELTNDAMTALGRIDWNINDRNSSNYRFSWNKGDGENSVAVGDAGVLFNPVVNAAFSNEGIERDRNYVFVGQLASTLSSSFVNDFRFQYARGERPREANAQTPLVTVNNVGIYGTRSFLPTTQQDDRFQFVDALSVIKGNHTFKFGGEFSDIKVSQNFGFNQFGSYSFAVSGDAALQILSLTPGLATDRRFDASTFYTQQIGNLEAAFRIQELAFYAQDAWRVTPRFTLNYGLRVEKQYNPEAETGNDTVINLVRNASFPLLGGNRYDPTVIPDSPWQFGPRLGFAWDANGDGKSVFRGYSGLYYARTPAIILAGPLNNYRIPPGDVTVQLPFTLPTSFNLTTFLAANPNYVNILQSTGANCTTTPTSCSPTTVFRQFAAIGINANSASLGSLPSLTAAQISQIAGALGLGITPALGANLFSVSPDYENPTAFQFGFGYERELRNGVVLGADYSQVKTTHLQRNRDINLPVPVADANGRPIFTRANRPVPTLGRVVLREDSGKSLYRALTLKIRAVRSWVNLNAYYTLSRSESDDDNERNATGIFYENTYNLQSEYGIARLDRTHQFVANPVFFIPYGFEVSSAIRLRSGTPFDATIGSDINGDSNNNDRPLSNIGVPFQRNGFRNRAENTVDLRVQKGVSFGENRRVVFSGEFFNVFNSANIQYGGAQTNYCATTLRNSACGLFGANNPSFRQLRDSNGNLITAGNFSRTPVFQMQLGARLYF